MTDDERRAKLTGKPTENIGNDEISDSLHRVLDDLSGSLLKVTESLHDVLSGLYTRDLESLDAAETAALIDFNDDEDPGALVPIVSDEIKKYKDENKIETLTVAEALDTETGKSIGLYKDEKELENPDIPACIFDVIMHRARERLEKEHPKEGKKNISIGAHKLDKVLYPLDPYNSGNMWNTGKIDGITTQDVYVGTKNKKKIYVPYWIDFRELQDDCPKLKDLNMLDKRVLIVSDGLYRAGNEYISFAQVHDCMGYKGNATGSAQEIRMMTDIYKKLNATVCIDNKEEAKAYKDKPIIKGWASFLPNRGASSENETIKINGKETHGFVKILDTSFVVNMAMDRKQISEVPIDVFKTPLKKDAANMYLEDYFLTWILHCLHYPGWYKPEKMSTIYYALNAEGTDATARKLRSRLRQRIATLLDYYVAIDLNNKKRHLVGYKIGNDKGYMELKIENMPTNKDKKKFT